MGWLVRLMGRGRFGDSDEAAQERFRNGWGRNRRDWRMGGAGG